MTWTLFITVIAVFAIRGLFAGFTGVIARISSLVLGYLSVMYYQPVAATFVSSLLAEDTSPMVISLLSSAGLFVTVYFITSTLIQLCTHALGLLVPYLKPLLSKRSTASSIAGLAINSCVGALLFLVGLWAYGLLLEPPQQKNALHLAADYVGAQIMKSDNRKKLSELNQLLGNKAEANSTTDAAADAGKQVNTMGSAIIISEANPEKQLSLLQNINPEQLTTLLEDSAITSKLIETLQNNPESMKELEALLKDNPEAVQRLLEYNRSAQ